jgi:hypothetical protein
VYRRKYAKVKTLGRGRKASDLVLIMTTSLYGQNSSQYNRLRFGRSLLYRPIGTTMGYGTLHVSNETFFAMRELADSNDINTSNRFGDGPNWRMRVIRSACDILGLDSDVILRHSFKRGLFAVPLATNYKSFLKGESRKPVYRNLPLAALVQHWQRRWFHMRLQNDLVVERAKGCSPAEFGIEKSIV